MPKDKKELSAFRISDARRARVVGGQAASSQAPEVVETSVGFPAIEGRLEMEGVGVVADELRASYEKLESLAGGADMRTKAAAKKAMAAYERCADLFEYLFETKSALDENSK